VLTLLWLVISLVWVFFEMSLYDAFFPVTLSASQVKQHSSFNASIHA
jgi:hypothetical protein